MTRRFALALAAFGACFAPTVQAQFSPYGQQPVWTPSSFGGQDHGHVHGPDGSCPMCMMSGSPQGSWPTPITPDYYRPSPFYNEAYDNLTGDDGWDYGASPFDALLLNAVKGAYFRLEYLNWTYKKPGNQPLGSAINGINEPREPFNVTVFGQLAGIARVPTLDAVDLGHRNGIRSTLGMPLPSGRGGIEASIFWLQDKSERTREFEVDGFPLGAPAPGTTDPPKFIVTSTFTNGVPGTNLFVYDESYQTRFSSDLWGTEINWVSDPYASGPGLQIRPMAGFRYIDIAEQLVQIGSFNRRGQLAQSLVSVITSRSDNAAFIPQVGVRLELVRPRWALGVEPKIGVGVIDIDNSVVTERLRSQGDPTITSQDSRAEISAVGEISLYMKANVTEKITVNFGYSFLFVDNVSRAHNSIFYNDNGQQADAAIVARTATELMYFQGINLGAEFRY